MEGRLCAGTHPNNFHGSLFLRIASTAYVRSLEKFAEMYPEEARRQKLLQKKMSVEAELNKVE